VAVVAAMAALATLAALAALTLALTVIGTKHSAEHSRNGHARW